MSDFDYGNARLHGMKSRLLTRPEMEELLAAGTVRGLINALTKTCYREAVELALVQFSDMAALNRAWRREWVNTLNKVQGFFHSGEAQDLLGWVAARYDVDNVKAVLRGLTQHVDANEILAGTLPVGRLTSADMARLSRLADARSAIDLLATWRDPLAKPLLRLRAERPGASLFQMELALERWYYRMAMACGDAREAAAFIRILRAKADGDNIMSALRLAGLPEATTFLRQYYGSDEAAPLLVGPGSIPWEVLNDSAAQTSIQRAVSKLAGTVYGEILSQALEQYRSSGLLSAFEAALTRYQLTLARSVLYTDPLGIGVAIGYLALKRNEINNLNRTAMGLAVGETADQIRTEIAFLDEL